MSAFSIFAQCIEYFLFFLSFPIHEKNKNLIGKQFSAQVERNIFVDWLKDNASSVSLSIIELEDYALQL